MSYQDGAPQTAVLRAMDVRGARETRPVAIPRCRLLRYGVMSSSGVGRDNMVGSIQVLIY